MPKKLLTDKLLKLGRILGVAKRKERNVVDRWIEMCNANGINTSDRMLQLIAWDLQQGGVDLAELKKTETDKKVQEVAETIDLSTMMKQIIQQQTAEYIAREQQHLEDLKRLYEMQRQKLLMEMALMGGNHGQAQGKGNAGQSAAKIKR